MNYRRPLSIENREELTPLRFSDYNYVLAVKTFGYGKDGVFRDPPKEIG